MKIPVKISPSPIVEAISEVRFTNDEPSAVIFGRLYAALSQDFPNTEQLPILQMPSEIRDRQPELKYTPHYRVRNDKYLVNIGQRTISVNRVCKKDEYSDWAEYFKVIKQVYKEVNKLEFIKTFDRVSVKYVNLFDSQKIDVTNFKFNFYKKEIKNYQDMMINFIQDLDGSNKIHTTLGSNASVQLDGEKKEGVVLTLDAFRNDGVQADKVVEVMDELHKIVEEKFFYALDEKYLKTLNPKYE